MGNKRNLTAGVAARRAAVKLLRDVLYSRMPLDEALAVSYEKGASGLDARDQALARLIVMTSLRRLGQIEKIYGTYLAKPLPKRAGKIRLILIAGVAQIVFLGMAAHAVADISVQLAGQDRRGRHLKGLVNAVLRKVAGTGAEIAADQDAARLNTPDWLWSSWVEAYGEEAARAIANANLEEPATDITVKGDAQNWAERLGGIVLDSGSVRLAKAGLITGLDGFADGEWWVQDTASSQMVRLLGDVSGKKIADLCAAPGGKTCQLAAAGANVTAVDISDKRMKRLEANIKRLKLEAKLVVADAAKWDGDENFDAILLDAPCSATGTIRRHPDVQRLKTRDDIVRLCHIQDRLLDHGAVMLKEGGRLVYCICSLQPEEGELRIAAFLENHQNMRIVPVKKDFAPWAPDAVTPQGYLRLMPFMLGGMDGFFAVCMEKTQLVP